MPTPKKSAPSAEPTITTVVTKEGRQLVTVISASSEETVPGTQQYSSYKHKGFVSQEFVTEGLDFEGEAAGVAEKSVTILNLTKAAHRADIISKQTPNPSNA